MPPFERGFKAWSERQAKRVRLALGFEPTDPLDVYALAESLGVVVLTPEDIPDLPQEHLDQLLNHDHESWSAVTLQGLHSTILIHNPRHSRARQASNIAHELAHVLLEHEGSKEVMSPGVEFLLRSYDSKQESEADWLGWVLLLPREALLARVRAGMGTEAIAREFGVSRQLATYRLRMTGVLRQASRSKR